MAGAGAGCTAAAGGEWVRPGRGRFAGPARVRPRAGHASRRRAAVCQASAGAQGGEDPYEVLGVSRFATTEQMTSARKKLLAACGGDEGCAARVESAYDRIVASQLALRMAGGDRLGLSVSKGFRFGDVSWLPAWSPRRDVVDAKALKLNAAVFGVLIMWGVLSSMAGTQPTMWSSVFTFFRVNEKVPAVAGGEARPDTLEEKLVPIRRLLRVLGLTFGPVAIGTVLIAFVPIAFMNVTGLAIPLTFLTKRDLLITLLTCTLQFYTCSFLR